SLGLAPSVVSLPRNRAAPPVSAPPPPVRATPSGPSHYRPFPAVPPATGSQTQPCFSLRSSSINGRAVVTAVGAAPSRIRSPSPSARSLPETPRAPSPLPPSLKAQPCSGTSQEPSSGGGGPNRPARRGEMQSMAASCSSSSSSSRAWAAARRSPSLLSLPSSRRAAFLSSPPSHGCRWPVVAALPLGIRGGLQLLPSPLLPSGVGRAGAAAARTRTAAAAAASPPAEEGGGKAEGAAGIPRTLQLGAMILVWYTLNIYFNIYNKLVLKAVPFPYTITTFHFASGSFFITLMWLLNLHPKPRLSLKQYAKLLPLVLIHVLGNVFTNVSLGKVSVSFTHTIKAMEPFFSVLLSVLFLGETPSLLVLGSLVPIVGGVVLASMTEVSFNWIGFWSAMASNLTNQSRNVFSKKILADKEDSLDDINLFSIMTIMAFLLSAPLMLSIEGIKFSPSYLQSAGVNVKDLCVKAALAGTCFHFYQQVSYSLLARISPVTHSVTNSLKRLVVIVSSVLFFRTPISPINALGTGVALAGVFLYSQLKKAKPKAT
ncbi:unnamed protein product, partial [Urochloa humidicola]